MDVIDKNILKVIGTDARTNVKQIAKIVGKSKETVGYRLNRMISDKTILSFYTNINCGKLGYSYYKILFKYKTMNSEVEREMLDFLKRDKNATWVGNCDGEFQLMVSLLVKDLSRLRNFIDSFLEKFGSYLYSKEILQAVSFNFLNENYLDVKVKGALSKWEDVACEREIVDEKDMEILRVVAGDARIKLVDIAGKVGLTAEAVSYRIKNLVRRGIISNFRSRINYSKLGYSYYQILVSVNNSSIKDKIKKNFVNRANCVAIIEFVGKYDLQLEFIAKDTGELRKIMRSIREKFGDKIEGQTSLMVYDEYGVVAFPKD